MAHRALLLRLDYLYQLPGLSRWMDQRQITPELDRQISRVMRKTKLRVVEAVFPKELARWQEIYNDIPDGGVLSAPHYTSGGAGRWLWDLYDGYEQDVGQDINNDWLHTQQYGFGRIFSHNVDSPLPAVALLAGFGTLAKMAEDEAADS
ncbi:MAG: hypothetical protein LBM73_02125 [Candidatus Nomurabacteria bacterium]|nr:hypothetical protein [Candidatus Nomurabacteria bacterium]